MTSKSNHKARKNRQIRRVMKVLDWVVVPQSRTVRLGYGGGLSRSAARHNIQNAKDNASED